MQLLPNATIAPSLYSFDRESIEDWAQAVLELTSEETFVVVGNYTVGEGHLRRSKLLAGRQLGQSNRVDRRLRSRRSEARTPSSSR